MQTEHDFLPKVLRDEQNLWNLVFMIVFAFLVLLMAFGLGDISSRISGTPLFDFFVLVLASFRLVRLFVYDKVFQFFRDFFLDTEESSVRGTKVISKIKPPSGPRRTMAEILECPWCTGVWLTLFAVFFYFFTVYAFFPLLVLAVSGAASFIQISANAVGWKAEKLKKETLSIRE